MHRRACRCEKTYTTAAGAVTVMRTLYRAQRSERAVAATERRVGIVEGYWTPLPARHAVLVSHRTPREAEEVLATLGNMQPSKSSLDRLPKALSTRWEAQCEDFEATVRQTTVEVPQAAPAVVVSLDGVMAPMRGRYRREAGCATASWVDGDGMRLHSVRLGRMPESKKATLKTMVAGEVEAVLGQRPDLKVVNLADGAADHWTFLSRALPDGVELIDFFHAAEPLNDASDTAHRDASPKACAQFEKYRHLLRHEPDGVETVIRAVVYRLPALEASEPRPHCAGAGLLPPSSPPHGLRCGEAPGIAHRLRRGRGCVQDLGDRAVQTFRYAMGQSRWASDSDSARTHPKRSFRFRVAASVTIVSRTPVLA